MTSQLGGRVISGYSLDGSKGKQTTQYEMVAILTGTVVSEIQQDPGASPASESNIGGVVSSRSSDIGFIWNTSNSNHLNAALQFILPTKADSEVSLRILSSFILK